MPPSYNVIEIGDERVQVTMHKPGRRGEEEPLATFARESLSTSEFYPAFERFVRFEKLPFMGSSPPEGRFEAGPGS
jgi:Icc protein